MVAIGVIGDFKSEYEAHRATNEALEHAAQALDTALSVSWVPTVRLSQGTLEGVLGSFDALWAAPGSPVSIEGALRGIRFARERGWPFVGT